MRDIWAPPFGRRRLGAADWAPPFGRQDRQPSRDKWAPPFGRWTFRRYRDFYGATVTFVLAVVHCSVNVNYVTQCLQTMPNVNALRLVIMWRLFWL